jgi:2'-5' RNA ligase
MHGDDMRLNELYSVKKPMFVGVRFDGPSMDEIMKLSKGVDNRTSKGELHITVAYSRAPISITALGSLEPPVAVKAKQYSIFKARSGENCLVVEVDSPDLVARHNEIRKDYGASYDFPEYKPHFTLSYDCGIGFDIRSLPPIEDIPVLYCHQEYASELRMEYAQA